MVKKMAEKMRPRTTGTICQANFHIRTVNPLNGKSLISLPFNPVDSHGKNPSCLIGMLLVDGVSCRIY